MMHEPYKKEIDRLVGVFAAEEEPDSLTRKASEELYAQLKTGSISRIEKYAGCAFEHFAGYGRNSRSAGCMNSVRRTWE